MSRSLTKEEVSEAIESLSLSVDDAHADISSVRQQLAEMRNTCTELQSRISHVEKCLPDGPRVNIRMKRGTAFRATLKPQFR